MHRGALRVKAALPSTLLASLLAANPGYAEPPFQSFGGGVFIGYGGNSLIWGLEGYATRTLEQPLCSSDPRFSFGPLARMTLHGASRPSFTLAAHGGRDLARPLAALSAEAGLTLAFRDGLGNEPTMSPHTGVSLELSIFQTFSHQEWLLPEYTVGGGVRYFPTIGTPGMCAIGRPQRNPRGERVATRLQPTTGDRKLDAFRKAAAEEYASVPAFLQLALELQANSAPSALVERALSAAGDELRHTTLCAHAIGYLSGELPVLDVPEVSPRLPLVGQEGLTRLAAESWFDGCLGEGLAAELAAQDERAEPDSILRRIHAVISRDERRHAELAWDVLRFCLQQQPNLRSLLRSLGAEAAPVTTADFGRDCLRHHHTHSRRRLQALCD